MTPPTPELPGPPPPLFVSRALAAITALGRTLMLSAMPFSCPCGEGGVHLCPACRASLGTPATRVDSVCDALQIAAPAPSGALGEEHYTSLLPVFALGPYAGRRRDIVLDFKNSGHFALAPMIAASFATALADVPCRDSHPHLIVPAPSRMAAVRRRGDDHMRLVVRALAGYAGADSALLVEGPALALGGHSQRARGARARVAAGDRTMTARRPRAWQGYRGAHALIIDDVVTTGSTLRLMVAALREQGVSPCAALTMASASMPRGRAVPGAHLPF